MKTSDDSPQAPAKPQTEGKGPDLGALITGFLTRALENTRTRVNQLNGLTETGVLGAGEALCRIVKEASNYANSARQTLEGITGTDDGDSIASLIKAQNEILANYIQQIQGRLERQSDVTAAAVQASSRIASLGKEISSVASQSRLLSLNASIEAGRMGESGRVFGVIAAEMTKLSRQVESTSKAVNALVADLSETLPNVAEAALDMRNLSGEFIDSIGASVTRVEQSSRGLAVRVERTLRLGDEAIATIVGQSNEALSSLQFQDPVAQGMIAVSEDLSNCLSRVQSLLSEEVALELNSQFVDTSALVEGPGEKSLEHISSVQDGKFVENAGEVLLF